MFRSRTEVDRDPDPWGWTGDGLAMGLSHTYRWAGYSAWDLTLSAAQHEEVGLLAGRQQDPGAFGHHPALPRKMSFQSVAPIGRRRSTATPASPASSVRRSA